MAKHQLNLLSKLFSKITQKFSKKTNSPHTLDLLWLNSAFCLIISLSVSWNIAQVGFLTYDEFVVNQISLLPLPQLFETIKSEPHPPGLYLLLHQLNRVDFLDPKLLLIALHHLVWFVCLWLATKSTKTKDWLPLGLGIIFATHLFAGASFYLKQDIITVPLFTLVLILYLQKRPFKSTPLVNILLLSILAFGYINYFFSILVAIALSLHHKQNKHLKSVLLIQAFAATTYFIAFGHHQLFGNIGRFEWTNHVNQSFLISTQVAVLGRSSTAIVSDLIFLSLLLPLSYAVSRIYDQISFGKFLCFLFFTIILLLFLDQLNLFARARHLTPFYFIFILCISKIVSKSKLKYLFLLSAMLLFFFSRQFFTHNINQNIIFLEKIQEITNQHKPQGFIYEGTNSGWYYQQFLELDTKSINPLFPDIYKDSRVSRQLLDLDKYSTRDFRKEEIFSNMKSAKLTSIILIQDPFNVFGFDPDDKIYASLKEICQHTEVLFRQDYFLIHFFDGCDAL